MFHSRSALCASYVRKLLSPWFYRPHNFIWNIYLLNYLLLSFLYFQVFHVIEFHHKYNKNGILLNLDTKVILGINIIVICYTLFIFKLFLNFSYISQSYYTQRACNPSWQHPEAGAPRKLFIHTRSSMTNHACRNPRGETCRGRRFIETVSSCCSIISNIEQKPR